MKHFTEVLRYLNNVNNINRGGCGISTLAMYRWLKKHKMLSDTKIVFLYDCLTYSLYNTNYEILNNNIKGIPEGAPHIIIKRQNRYIDSNGILSAKSINDRFEYKLEVDAEFLLTAVNNHLDRWNASFAREIELPKIEKQLKINLSDVVFN